MSPSRSPDTARRRELAKIHLAAKQIGLDEETYRGMLWTVARVHSAKDLDEAGRARVLDHLKSRGFRSRRQGRPTPAGDKVKLVAKIRAMLATARRPDAYGDGMSKRMFGVDRYEWCEADQLRRLVAALSYDAKRHGRRTK